MDERGTAEDLEKETAEVDFLMEGTGTMIQKFFFDNNNNRFIKRIKYLFGGINLPEPSLAQGKIKEADTMKLPLAAKTYRKCF